jgi:MFS superfamily sulfate permease-like transporter
VLAALTSIALMPLFTDLPSAALGAIVISAVMGFISIPSLRRIQALSRISFVFALIALFGVLFLGILPGLLLTVALSILLLLGRQSRPQSAVLGRLPGTRAYLNVERHPEVETEPGLLIFRLDSPLMFINATWVRDALRERLGQAEPPARVVLFDLEFSSALDIKSLDVLAGLTTDLQQQGIELWLANVHAGVREMLDRGGLTTRIGDTRFYHTIDEAVVDFRAGAAPVPAAGAGSR